MYMKKRRLVATIFIASVLLLLAMFAVIIDSGFGRIRLTFRALGFCGVEMSNGELLLCSGWPVAATPETPDGLHLRYEPLTTQGPYYQQMAKGVLYTDWYRAAAIQSGPLCGGGASAFGRSPPPAALARASMDAMIEIQQLQVTRHCFADFGFQSQVDANSRWLSVVIPLSTAAEFAGAAAVFALLYCAYHRLAGRTRKRHAKYCDSCGYDLRASSYRCPECGAQIELRRL